MVLGVFAIEATGTGHTSKGMPIYQQSSDYQLGCHCSIHAFQCVDSLYHVFDHGLNLFIGTFVVVGTPIVIPGLLAGHSYSLHCWIRLRFPLASSIHLMPEFHPARCAKTTLTV